MKVKSLAKHFSKASKGSFIIEKDNGRYSFSFEGLDELIINDAPILSLTVGMIKVIDNDLIICAY